MDNLTELKKDKERLDWLDSINPIGCWDGWVEEGEHSHAITVWIKGEWGSSREAIDKARGVGSNLGYG